MQQSSESTVTVPVEQMVGSMALLPAWLRRLGYYGLALLFVAVAALLRWAFSGVLNLTPFLVFYLALVGAAAFGGLGPGLLATLASWLCIDFLFDPTPGHIGFDNSMSVVRLLVFLAGGLVVSVVGEKMRRTRAHERRQAGRLAELAGSLESEKDTLQAVMNGARNSHLVYLDRDFNFVRVNEAYARTCGYAPQEMIGKNHFALYPDAENEAIFARVRDTGVPFEVHDKPFVFPDQPERGTTYWDWTLTPIKNDAGYVEGLVFSLFETTQRKQAEEALRESEQRLSLAQQVAHVGTFDWDIRTGVNVWTPELEGMYGLPPGGFAKTQGAWEQLVHPDDRVEAHRLVDQAFETSAPTEGEWRVLWPDGSVHWLSGRWQVFKDESGTPLRMTGVNIDITDRKRAEEALRASEASLAKAQAIAHLANWEVDVRTNIVRGSQELYILFDLEPDVALDNYVEKFHPEDRPRVVESIRAAIHEGQPYSIDYRIIPRPGVVRWVHAEGAITCDDEGRPLTFFGTVQDITERKQAEDELVAELQFMALLNEVSEAFLHQSDLQPVLDKTVEAAVVLAGADMSNLQFFDPGSGRLQMRAQRGFQPRWLEFWEKTAEGEGTCGTAMQCGAQVIVEDVSRSPIFAGKPALDIQLAAGVRAVVSTPLVSSKGQFMGMFSVHFKRPHRPAERVLRRLGLLASFAADIVELSRIQAALRESEELLRESEERFRTMADGSPNPIWVTNAAGERIFANRQYREYFGVSAAEMEGGEWKPFVHPDDAPTYVGSFLSSLQERRPFFAEARVKRADGQWRWIESRAEPRFSVGGEFLGLVGITQDIMERKEAEAALKESEEKYRRIVETATEGIVMVDTEARIVFVNARWSEIFGYRAEEAGRITLFDLVFPEDMVRMKERWESRKRGQKETYEFRFRRKDGRPVWVLVGVAPRFDSEGEFLGTLVLTTDITERKQAEEALHELNATLESKVARRTAELEHRARQLQKLTLELSETEERERKRLAELLHDDLQQVLAAAKFHLGRVGSGTRGPGPSQEIVEQVKEMLRDAIEKSRDLSHELSPAVLYHDDVAETLGWLAQQMQAKHGLAVRVEVLGEVKAQSDVVKVFVYRAAQELLFNVVKHARVNEARIRIRCLGRYLCLSVSDRGRGFDAQEMKETAGFGLLSIRERVALLGGRMKTKSAKGRGTTFRIVVPDAEPSGTGVAMEWQTTHE